MEEAIILVVGSAIITGVRILFKKKSGTSDKIRYTNYSKYVIRNKKYNQSISDQAKPFK